MDPQHRVFLEETWKAIEDAGYSGDDLDGARCSVFVGCGNGDFGNLLRDLGVAREGYLFTGNSSSILAARISYLLNLRGASVPIDTACSSSLVALHMACGSLRTGESDLAIAGGVAVMTTPEFHILASSSGMLSLQGKCQAFAASADGFVPGEGAGVVMLKRLDDALRDGDAIHAVIVGSGINQDGKTNGITSPSGPAQTALECAVYDTFQIDPKDISYLEAHGTGTKLGDPIEVDALTAAFQRYTDKPRFCALGSVKSNIGHTLTASGMASIVKVVMCLRRGELVPSLHAAKENPLIDFESSPFRVVKSREPWTAPRRLAGVSSFGFSGTNAHVLLAEAPAPPARSSDVHDSYLVVLSAKTPEALERRRSDLAAWLSSNGDRERLRDIAFTTRVGRSHFPHRDAFVAKDKQELLRLLAVPTEATKGESTSAKDVAALVAGITEDRRAKLDALARIFVRGGPVPGAEIDPGEDHRRVHLPPYHFANEAIGLPEVNGEMDDRSASAPGPRAERLHPLLHHERTTLREARFETELDATSFFLRDHVVAQRTILPAVAILEMAHAGATRAFGEAIALRDVAFLGPVDVERKRRIALVVKTSGDWTLETEHGKPLAEGRIDRVAERAPSIARLNGSGRAPARFYERFIDIGVSYGPAFRTVRTLAVEGSTVRAELESVERSSELSLDPGMLDGALQTLMAIGTDAEQRDLALPFHIGRVDVWGSIPDRAQALVSRTTNAGARIAKFEVTVATLDGTPCVRLSDVSVRRVEKVDPIASVLADLERGRLTVEEAEKLLEHHGG